MLEVELLGGERLGGTLTERDVIRLCTATAGRLGVEGGHVAVEIVDPATIEELNTRHRGRPEPTDVLSFPIDGVQPLAGDDMRELGDIVICPEHTVDMSAAVVHGMLHLLGMDHERDDGEMLALQDELLGVGGLVSSSGIVALAGRPNVGKSTLLNSIVGQKLSIVSDRPQTTRRAIRGVIIRGDSQVVLVDLPGTQRPRDPLTARLAKRVQHELEGADGVLLLLNGLQGVGAGDRHLAGVLADTSVPVTVAVNKVDKLSRPRLMEVLSGAAELVPEAEIFPISALRGTGVTELMDHLAATMPEGPFLFEPGVSSDQPLEQLLAELIREAVIRRTFQELPHAVEVVVEDLDRPREGLTRVRALIWVESESQKAILIGARGNMIRAIGSASRAELERELESHVHLDLSVRVRRRWRNDEALLDRLGMT